MRSKSVNFWHALGWFVLGLTAVGTGWAGISGYVGVDSATKAAVPQHLANGTPGIGKYPRGGACPTGTSIDTSTGTTDRQCWSKIPASDVEGLPSIAGTTDYLPVKTPTGWGDSPVYKDGTGIVIGNKLRLLPAGDAVYMQNLDVGSFWFTGAAASTLGGALSVAATYGLTIHASSGSPFIAALRPVIGVGGGEMILQAPDSNFGFFRIPSAGGNRTWIFPATQTAGRFLYDTDGSGTLGEKAITAADVGAEPTLPACAPGQFPQYTGTGTSVTTAKGCSTGVAYSFSTATPLTVGTSGSVGTSTQVNRADHRHAFDGKIPPYSGQTPQYLKNALVSPGGTIIFAEGSGLVNVDANVGTGAGTVAAGNDSRFGKVKVSSAYTEGYLYDRVQSTNGTISIANNAGMLNINANTGTTSGTVCAGNDARLSDARTPTAHGSTHNPGGSDALSAFTNTPGVNKVATLTAAGQNLDGWTTATATPGASVIVKSNASGNVNGWLSTSAAPFTNTPGVGKVATLTAAGQTLNGWVTGILVNTEVVTSSSDYWTTTGVGWSSGPSYTFTSNGTRLNVTVETTVAPTSTTGYSFCALTIVADNGATASTQRGKETFLPITPSSGVADTPISGHYLLGALSNHANFTLGSTGQTTITVRMYQGGSMVACTVPAGYLKMYVDVYK